jgi:hypothetical protein
MGGINKILFETMNLAHSGAQMGVTFLRILALASSDVTRLVRLHFMQLDTTPPCPAAPKRNTQSSFENTDIKKPLVNVHH